MKANQKKKMLGVCPRKLHKVCSASVERLCKFPGFQYYDDLLAVYSCMGQQNESDIDKECLALVKSDPISNARAVCAPEIFAACPQAGYVSGGRDRHVDSSCQKKRCVHDLFSKGMGDKCKAAFDVAFAQYKEIEGIPATEISPMDIDVMRILVPHPEAPLDAAGKDDYELMFLILGSTAVVSIIIMLYCCMKNRRTRVVRRAAVARSSTSPQNDYMPMSEADNYHPLVDNAPSAPPVAHPYRNQSVVIVATPVTCANRYPGIN